jgi:hypothetical protein
MLLGHRFRGDEQRESGGFTDSYGIRVIRSVFICKRVVPFAPSPLEGEGWGGGYSSSLQSFHPPPGSPHSPTSPSRGEVT